MTAAAVRPEVEVERLDEVHAPRTPRGDREVDDALDDSFPASDPPSWWAGADRPSA